MVKFEWICNGLSDRCGSPDGRACVVESEYPPNYCLEYPKFAQDYNVRDCHRKRNICGDDNGKLRDHII